MTGLPSSDLKAETICLTYGDCSSLTDSNKESISASVEFSSLNREGTCGQVRKRANNTSKNQLRAVVFVIIKSEARSSKEGFPAIFTRNRKHFDSWSLLAFCVLALAKDGQNSSKNMSLDILILVLISSFDHNLGCKYLLQLATTLLGMT